MRHLFILAASFGLCLVGAAADAQVTVLATCKDGSSWSGAHKRGACRGHGGVQTYGAPVTAAPTSSQGAPTTAPPVTAAPAQLTGPRPAPAAIYPSPVSALPAGGAGQVWVNTSTKVYHCPSDPYYGKTKHGTYMTESAARAAGAHADHGKACS